MATLRTASSGDARIKNGFRIDVDPGERQRVTVRYLVEKILEETLKVNRDSIYCLQDNVKNGRFVLVLDSLSLCQDFYRSIQENLSNSILKGFVFTVLYTGDDVPLVVMMYNPYVEKDDVILFLQRYCSSIRYSHKVKNEVGVWTGKHKFFVKFKPDFFGTGGICHPPANFSIGREKGYLFYPGMPSYCRKCKKHGHVQAECKDEVVYCNKCGQQGHSTLTCTEEIVCNVCGEKGHAFRKCPKRTWAEVAGGRHVVEESGESSGQQAESVSEEVIQRDQAELVGIPETSVAEAGGHSPVEAAGGWGSEAGEEVMDASGPDQKRKKEDKDSPLVVKRAFRQSASEGSVGASPSASDPINILDFESLEPDIGSPIGIMSDSSGDEEL